MDSFVFLSFFLCGFWRRRASLHIVFSTLLQRYSTAAAAKPLNRLSNGLDDHKKGIEAESGNFHKTGRRPIHTGNPSRVSARLKIG